MKCILAISIIIFTLQTNAQHETRFGGSLKATAEGGNFVLDYAGEYKSVGSVGNTELDVNAAYGLNWPMVDDNRTEIDRIDTSLEQVFKHPVFLGLDLRTNFRSPTSPTMRVRGGAGFPYHDFTIRAGAAVEWLERDNYQRGIGGDLTVEFERTYRDFIEIESKAQTFIGEKKSFRNYNSLIILMPEGLQISIDFNVFVSQFRQENTDRPACNCADLNTEKQLELLVKASYKFGSN